MRRLFPILIVAMLVGASGALASLAHPPLVSAANCQACPEKELPWTDYYSQSGPCLYWDTTLFARKMARRAGLAEANIG